jgi:hypothetical protein
VAGVVRQHGFDARHRRVDAGEHQRRIEVALNDHVVAESLAGISDRGAPVEPDHVWAGAVHRLEQVIAADPEVDRRRIGVAHRELGEHAPRVGEHQALVVTTRQRPRP